MIARTLLIMATCTNCSEKVSRDGGVTVAGMVHCRACARLVDGQMKRTARLPGQPVKRLLFRCTQCGVGRVGRSGEPSRCLICTDERTDLSRARRERHAPAPQDDTGWGLDNPWGSVEMPRSDGRRNRLAGLSMVGPAVRRRDMTARAIATARLDDACTWASGIGVTVEAGERGLNLPIRSRRSALEERQVAREKDELDAHLAMLGTWELFKRPGWTIRGSSTIEPLGNRSGVWGTHRKCGRLREMTQDTPMRCTFCGDSRVQRPPTWQRNRRLLYLVSSYDAAMRPHFKFGIGRLHRVREHVTNGATVVRVLEGSYLDVERAEARLKTMHYGDVPDKRPPGLPGSFGAGSRATEVVPGTISVDLAGALPDGEDVADEYRGYFTGGLLGQAKYGWWTGGMPSPRPSRLAGWFWRDRRTG